MLKAPALLLFSIFLTHFTFFFKRATSIHAKRPMQNSSLIM